MHASAHYFFRQFVLVYMLPYQMRHGGFSVLDVGSQDVNGNLRNVLYEVQHYQEPQLNYSYLGLDLGPGRNVDVMVGDDPWDWSMLANASFDFIISSSCFEHDPFFWLTIKEMARVVKPQGYLYVSAPATGPYHGYPSDLWRFYEDSWHALSLWDPRLLLMESGVDRRWLSQHPELPGVPYWNDSMAIYQRRQDQDVPTTPLVQRWKDAGTEERTVTAHIDPLFWPTGVLPKERHTSHDGSNQDAVIIEEGPLRPSDIAAAIITSASTITTHLPLLWDAWARDAPFTTVFIADRESTVHLDQLSLPRERFIVTDCPSTADGLHCKTVQAFEQLSTLIPEKRWLLRLTDDTLVLPDALVQLLRALDTGKPLCVGDFVDTPQMPAASYPQARPGWAINRAAARVLIPHIQDYQKLADMRGRSAVTPEYQTQDRHAHEQYWGLFLSLYAVEKRSVEGWLSQPVEVRSGVQRCDPLHVLRPRKLRRVQPLGRNGEQGLISGLRAFRPVSRTIAVVPMRLCTAPAASITESWMSSAAEVADVLRDLRQRGSTSWAVFEGAPYMYHRLCVKHDDDAARPALSTLESDIRANVLENRTAVAEVLLHGEKRIVPVGLCDDVPQIVMTVSGHVDAVVLRSVHDELDAARDTLRLHYPPSHITLSKEDVSQVPRWAVARVGDDVQKVGATACKGFVPDGDVSACAERVAAALDSRFPPALRFSELCRGGGKQFEIVETSW